MALSSLERVRQEVAKCNRCGFCQTACPVYQVTRRESSTARGHHYQVRNILEGRLEPSSEVGRPLFECLLCRACVPHCFAPVQTDRVVAAGRQSLAPRSGWTALLPFAFRRLLLNPRRLDRYAKGLALAKRMGLDRMAALAGGGLARAQHLTPGFPRQTLQERVKDLSLEPASPRGKVAYFVGCGTNYLLPQTGEATINHLVASGYTVEVTRNYCCGLPPYTYGDLATARRLAKGNLRLLNYQGVEAVVTDCASCSSFLKDYPNLLADDPDFAGAATLMAGKVLDITEWLSSHGQKDNRSEVPLSVTYHDPCHASRYQGLREEPRRILRGIPGLRLVEMEEADWCCGGAGTYSLTHPDLAQRILDRKIDNVARTGAEVLVTSCPSCLVHLSYGVRRRGLPVRVMHLTEVLEMARRGEAPGRNP